MNRHVTDGELIAYLDGELTGEPTARLAAHLRECAACRRGRDELRSASRRLTAALERIDRPPPRSIRPPVIRPRRPAPEASPDGGETSAGPRRWWIAAALVLAAGTAAAAVPGSPVRAWLEGSLGPAAEAPAPPAATTPEAGPDAPSGPGETAVALRADGPLAIIIREPAADTRVRVRLVEGARASVRATGARYRTARNRIEVLGPESGELRISIPRGVPDAYVEVDGRVIVRKEGGDLRVLTPADTADSEVLFRLDRGTPDGDGTGGPDPAGD